MDELCQVTITAPDPDWLAQFVHGLLADRLCAVGHILTNGRSIYRWRGEVFDHEETYATLHTRAQLVAEIVRRADQSHPYEVPCVVVAPLVDGGPAYLSWVLAETEPVSP